MGRLGASWGVLERLRARCGPSGAASGAQLGLSWGSLEALLGRLGAFLGRLGAWLGRLRLSSGPPEPSRGDLGRPWGRPWGRPGPFLARNGGNKKNPQNLRKTYNFCILAPSTGSSRAVSGAFLGRRGAPVGSASALLRVSGAVLERSGGPGAVGERSRGLLGPLGSAQRLSERPAGSLGGPGRCHCAPISRALRPEL